MDTSTDDLPPAVEPRIGPGNRPVPRDLFAKARHHERAEVLAAARAADILPYFHVLTSPAMPVVEMEGAQRIMLGSNNYLGLTGDDRVLAGAQEALHRYGTGLTGSRPLNGTTPLHLELEAEIAEWIGSEDALVFTTGHQANLGTLGTILGVGDTVIADSGDHASILDGCLLSRAKLRPFRHNRLDKLEKMLGRADGDGGGVLVVVDGVFSMEGDIAPLSEICELCQRHGARLMVDEAHGAGVLGARGAGTAELLGLEERVDLRVGTFSKSLASCGGFVAGPADVLEYLRYYSRAFIFTASAVPAALGAALAALRVLRSPDGAALLARVLDNAWRLRDGLHELGFAVVAPQPLPERPSVLATRPEQAPPTTDSPGDDLGLPTVERPGGSHGTPGPDPQRHPPAAAPGVRLDADGAPTIVTPIVPVLVGDDWKAALLWRALYDAGVFVNTALHPAVPPGGALLRTSVMATHDEAVIDRALEAFARVKGEFEAEHGPLPRPGSS
ncbi:MAG TPA: aminotransferase class I/II-fold pyridoxal phosphate-dependent enzyme [Solirubrobacteraceae bacterium]|jgi:8-amino-7-oxononanoate synthase|nr:aminotransferase class I/II-fold pyridoxal phosphate-dependent enzyme [Solirubrobacteraceae bacterium]